MQGSSCTLRRTFFTFILLVLPLTFAQAAAAAGNGIANKACDEDDCPALAITCGQTVMGSLSDADFRDDQGRSFDPYAFSGASGDQIAAMLHSDDFEPHLELRTPGGEDAAEAEGNDPGSTAQLDYVLTSSSNGWRLIVKADDAGVAGDYSLTLQCNAAPPPPEGFFIDPEYPDFAFRVTIGDQGDTRPGVPEPICEPDTACVSGALPGRSELFLRILGPRPNGFLWPTIVRFTPSRVVVEIVQLSTGQTQTYILDAIPPGVDELPGLQDRMGFVPQP